MRELPAFEQFMDILADRQRALGMAPELFASARNSGRRRTPEKRELLRRLQARALGAGVAPVPANF